MVSRAVLDKNGSLVAKASYRPNAPQDPASTTKVWTLYTLMHLADEGKFKKSHGIDNAAEFVARHKDDILYMTMRSSNYAPYKLAWEYGHALVGTGKAPASAVSPPKLTSHGDYPASVQAIIKEMNSLASENGMSRTNFLSPHGHSGGWDSIKERYSAKANGFQWPNVNRNGEQQVSTAKDLATIMYVFRKDFPEHIELLGTSNAKALGSNIRHNARNVLSHPDIDSAKTGTGDWRVGDKGRHTLIAGGPDISVAVAGGANRNLVHSTVRKLASDIPVSKPSQTPLGRPSRSTPTKKSSSDNKWATSDIGKWFQKQPEWMQWGMGLLGAGAAYAGLNAIGGGADAEQPQEESFIWSAIMLPFRILFSGVGMLAVAAFAIYHFFGDQIKQALSGNERSEQPVIRASLDTNDRTATKATVKPALFSGDDLPILQNISSDNIRGGYDAAPPNHTIPYGDYSQRQNQQIGA